MQLSGEPLYQARTLATLYTARGDAPAWVAESGPRPDLQQLLAAIRQCRAEGLWPADYHYYALSSLLDRLATPDSNAAERERQLAALELLASDAFLALANDALNGRVDPAGLNPPAGFNSHRRDLTPELKQVMAGADPQVIIQSLLPQTREYQALRTALADYRARAAAKAQQTVPGGGALRPGDHGARVVALINRLQTEGDLGPGAARDETFNPAIEAAVKQFQARHGLVSDGIVGRDTLAALNEPLSEQINRIRVNLERLRWLPRDLPPERIMVNIADFSATLYAQDRALLKTAAIVGQAERQTPQFSDRIQYLVVNPGWDVPADIAGDEILPLVQHNPDYLTEHGYQVLEGSGATEHEVDPRHIDWKQLTAATLPYRFRQKPGRDNPLGQVKFIFPNHYDVYLHDTPSRGLFSACRRTFSHGCIRVAEAMPLAIDLLRLDDQSQPEARLAAAVKSGKTQRIDLHHPVSIYILYLTAWVNAAGVLESRPDVYHLDPQVLGALDAPPPGIPPVAENPPGSDPAAGRSRHPGRHARAL